MYAANEAQDTIQKCSCMRMGQVGEAITRPSNPALNEVTNDEMPLTLRSVVLSELISTVYHQNASNRGTRKLSC